METIYIIFLIFLGGAVVTYFAGKINSLLQDVLFLASVLIPTYLFYVNYSVGDVVGFQLGNISLSWGINYFGWLFSLIVLGLGSIVAFYAVSFMKGKERRGYFYFNYIFHCFFE